MNTPELSAQLFQSAQLATLVDALIRGETSSITRAFFVCISVESCDESGSGKSVPAVILGFDTKEMRDADGLQGSKSLEGFDLTESSGSSSMDHISNVAPDSLGANKEGGRERP